LLFGSRFAADEYMACMEALTRMSSYTVAILR
jgi:hypothetical protein